MGAIIQGQPYSKGLKVTFANPCPVEKADKTVGKVVRDYIMESRGKHRRHKTLWSTKMR